MAVDLFPEQQRSSLEFGSTTEPSMRDDQSGRLPLIAYPLTGIPAKLVPATADRPWMSAFNTTFANRCLPMRIANQDGWFVLNPTPISILWNGGNKQEDITITVLDGTHTPALSHFGHGIVTWWIPYLFRTPPGYNMYVRGPVNYPKDGICALHAIVETDWAVASFPMSWKLTRPGLPIRFDRDEPICMVSPVRRGETESFDPQLLPITADMHSQAGHAGWSESRRLHNESLRLPNPPKKWEKHYFLGTHPTTEDKFPEHQVKLAVRPFQEVAEATKAIAQFDAAMRRGLPKAPEPELRSCPFPHPIAAMSCPAAQTSSPAPSVAVTGIVREPDFFERFPECEQLVNAWFATDTQPKELTKPGWEYEYAAGRLSLLSCDPAKVIPADLLTAIRHRLDAWAVSHGYGQLRSLQLSLLTTGAFRAASQTHDEAYFALPLRIAKGVRVRGGRLYSSDIKMGRGLLAGVLGKTTHLVPEPNCLISFVPGLSVGIEQVNDSPDPADSLLLLEGTVAGS
ncbi:hypothetical protein SAMN05421770_10267 [Granulicella rosea]|uniref:Uncharacterized protein n=1 Tax=Granulicella rosea TaxID=474952 RepID=A0A239GTC5_9BACT|nr:DUF6065 family protein [Granulicella rosea]SNS72221.1 hypothetical protein SAMN05421770_10267 [Granulicella rosea]